MNVHLSPSNLGKTFFKDSFNSSSFPSRSKVLSQRISDMVAFLSVYVLMYFLCSSASSSSMPIFSNIDSIVFASAFVSDDFRFLTWVSSQTSHSRWTSVFDPGDFLGYTKSIWSIFSYPKAARITRLKIFLHRSFVISILRPSKYSIMFVASFLYVLTGTGKSP